MFYSTLYFFTAYLIGSIPSGWLVARARGITDICKHGSGDIGATNVARSLGERYFFIVFFLDACKAFLFIWFMSVYIGSCSCLLIYACALLVGNTRSIFLDFKGGKGIAASFGLLLAINPTFLVSILPVWLFAFVLTRTVGIASVAALLSAPVIAFVLKVDIGLILLTLFISLWCTFLHRDNIKNYLTKK